MNILAIDPGYDRMAFALFNKGRVTAVGSENFNGNDVRRLAAIGQTAEEWQKVCEPTYTVVELPSIFGVYGRNRGAMGGAGMAAGMWKLGMATGALIGMLEAVGAHVILEQADRTPRAKKQEFARLVLARDLPGKLSNDDVRSAIWIGIRYLGVRP